MTNIYMTNVLLISKKRQETQIDSNLQYSWEPFLSSSAYFLCGTSFFKGLLNSSPIDVGGEGTCKVCGGVVNKQAQKGNHGNPVNGNHPSTVTLNTQWNIEFPHQYLPRRRGGTGAKLFSATVHAAQREQNG